MPHTNKEEGEKKHKCCDGECSHDDCCGKIPENCPNYPSPTEEKKGEATGESWEREFAKDVMGISRPEWFDSLSVHEQSLCRRMMDAVKFQIENRAVVYIRSLLSTTEQAVREETVKDIVGFANEMKKQSEKNGFIYDQDYVLRRALGYAKDHGIVLSPQEHTKE